MLLDYGISITNGNTSLIATAESLAQTIGMSALASMSISKRSVSFDNAEADHNNYEIGYNNSIKIKEKKETNMTVCLV